MKANLDKNLAPAWVSGKSYSTGEFCLYNKRLYICIEDNSDTEFDNSKWEIRNLVDLVSGINSNLNNINESMSFGTSGTTHTSEIGKYYIAFRIANTTVDSQRKITFEGVEFAKELLGVTSTSVGCVYAIYLIKASDTTVTSSLTCLLMQISK